MIEGNSTASELLDLAYNAHCEADAETWERLPLRYGPYCRLGFYWRPGACLKNVSTIRESCRSVSVLTDAVQMYLPRIPRPMPVGLVTALPASDRV
jgi:hypothetical protein